jgi:hypothetical protein
VAVLRVWGLREMMAEQADGVKTDFMFDKKSREDRQLTVFNARWIAPKMSPICFL